MIRGSKVPLRSRDTSSYSVPKLPFSVLADLPLRFITDTQKKPQGVRKAN
jgi:hypothetical protein